MAGKKVFIEITNEDIYKEIQSMKDMNSIQHLEIIEHQAITNGKVKRNQWIASTALGTVFTVLPFILYIISK